MAHASRIIDAHREPWQRTTTLIYDLEPNPRTQTRGLRHTIERASQARELLHLGLVEPPGWRLDFHRKQCSRQQPFDELLLAQPFPFGGLEQTARQRPGYPPIGDSAYSTRGHQQEITVTSADSQQSHLYP